MARTLSSGRLIGLIVTTMWLFIAATPAHAEWRRAETTHFIIYGDVSERQIIAYAKKVERFDALLRAYYPIQINHEIPKLEIFLANGRRDMLLASPGIGEGVGGYYSPNSNRIHAVVDTDAMNGDVVLFHEYAHHFMFQMRSNAYPSWFVEGFAEYYSTADVRADRIQFGRHNPGRMNSLTLPSNSWARMEDVLAWRYSRTGRYPAHAYYAQSWAMTHYFMSTPERTAMLGRYLSAVVGGVNSVEAMQTATGRTPSQLQNDVWSYVSGRIKTLTPTLDMRDPDVTVTVMSPAAAALAWLDLRLDLATLTVERADEEDEGPVVRTDDQKARDAREREEVRASMIRDALAISARYPGDRVAILSIARAQRLSHEPAQALSTLEPLLSDSSTDSDALRLASAILLGQASVEAETDVEAAQVLRRRANGYLTQAMEISPLDFRIYLGLNDTRRTQSSYPNENDVLTLEAAMSLAPQSFDARMRLASAYMSRDLNHEAISVLGPVANSPHAGSHTRRARQMIATARTALGQTVTETDEDLLEEPVEETL